MQRRDFLKSAAVLGASTLPFIRSLPASAATDGVVVVAMGQTINSLDIHRTGTNRPSYQVAVNVYDRLVSFGTKSTPDGGLSYDYSTIVPEVAESWTVSDDGTHMTFNLRKNGVFHDGSPITAQDVKWSFDRAVTVGGFPTVQMKAGSLEKPEQFEVIDDYTFKINLLRPSKLTLPDLAVPVPMIINSKVAMEHATTDDPWATEYLHKTPAGSGAYKVARWEPGQQLVYERNDNWTSGPVPAVKRVIVREVPSQATRRALLERGDIQMSFNMPNKDAKELSDKEGIDIFSTPVENAIYCLCPNLAFEPFKNKLVRQAVAYSVPYEDVFQTAAYGRGVKMWGGASATPSDIAWPQPFPYSTDLDKAKDLLDQTEFKGGFEVPLSISLSQTDWMEPTALLIQENLAKIGIKATIDKIPGANWRTASLVEKRLPLALETFGGWLNYPCYYFFWAYLEGHLFNSSNYRNEEIEKLTPFALHKEVDDPEYAPAIKRMIEIAWDEVPRIALFQPALNVGTNGMEGYEYWFHRQLDARGFKV
ncbi:ABC transporter substrate-binding protein [Hwanghaeella grinnelliae]|uniref:ABC transporter substrate-binding protein n=1 Tax=Hwanghaeella grinnelliae TaxID=2500179 RepID=A0A3S3UMQ3_9PROT|nr:ABC transporter substrate-binding protein [Hwanghaeella grinnelliae]RVU35125.1 ABC transporter substrate-binding protein [Hwanghaeella grinnelliae]